MLKIFVLKMEEDGSWRKKHNDELSVYSPDRLIESRRLGAGRVACMGRGVYILVGRSKEKRPLGRLAIGGKLTLRWSLVR
jgi:hypothetical protein